MKVVWVLWLISFREYYVTSKRLRTLSPHKQAQGSLGDVQLHYSSARDTGTSGQSFLNMSWSSSYRGCQSWRKERKKITQTRVLTGVTIANDYRLWVDALVVDVNDRALSFAFVAGWGHDHWASVVSVTVILQIDALNSHVHKLADLRCWDFGERIFWRSDEEL